MHIMHIIHAYHYIVYRDQPTLTNQTTRAKQPIHPLDCTLPKYILQNPPLSQHIFTILPHPYDCPTQVTQHFTPACTGYDHRLMQCALHSCGQHPDTMRSCRRTDYRTQCLHAQTRCSGGGGGGIYVCVKNFNSK